MRHYDIVLVDGRHALWRSADAFRGLSVEIDGEMQPTGAAYGLLNLAVRVKSEFCNPGGCLVVCWEGGSLRRRELYPEYKRRDPVPDPAKLAMVDAIQKQEGLVRKLLRGLGVMQAHAVGWEADDTMGTLATRYERSAVGIYTGDHDLYQCVTRTVHVLKPGRTGTIEVLTPETVVRDTKLSPRAYLYAKALSGDRGDNIPGVRGVGPVAAVKVVQAAEALAEQNESKLSLRWIREAGPTALNMKQRMQLTADVQAGNLKLWYSLCRIRRNVDVQIDHGKAWPRKKLVRRLMQLRFASWLQQTRLQTLMGLGLGRLPRLD